MQRLSRLSLIAVTSVFLFGSIARGQAIDLVVDQSQSSVLVSIPALEGSDTSSITGNAIIELDPPNEPFGTAHVTALNLTLQDGFTISHPLVDVSVMPGGAVVSFIQIGVPGAVNASNQFDQVGNLFGVTGMSFVDPLIGPNSEVDLATVKPVPFEIVAAQLETDGNQLTLTSDVFIPFEFEVLGGMATMTLDGAIVLTGTLPETTLLGDVNCDGSVDLLDVAPFVDLISTGQFDAKADINEDMAVDLLDVGPFVTLLGG